MTEPIDTGNREEPADGAGWAKARRRLLLGGAMLPVAAVGIAGLGKQPAHAAAGDVTVEPVTREQLRAMTESVADRVFWLTDHGAEGHFVPDPDDTETADNTGTVIVTAAGARLKRVVDGAIDVGWFGAVANGQTADRTRNSEAIQAALDVAGALAGPQAASRAHSAVRFGDGDGYVTDQTIHIPSRVHVDMNAPVLYRGPLDQPAIDVGEPDVANFRVQLRLQAWRAGGLTEAEWADERHVGIVLRNLTTSRVQIDIVRGFAIGVQCIGDSAGFAYNELSLGELVNNKIGLDLTNRNSGGGIGWCNENLYLGGRFSQNTSSLSGIDRIGIRITSQDGTYVNNNNNIIIKPSFEMRGSQAAPGEALPILVEHGTQNSVEGARNENNTGNLLARVLNDSHSNTFSAGFGYAFLEDRSSYAGPPGVTRRRSIADQTWAGFTSGPLRERACFYDGDSLVQIPGVGFSSPTSSELAVAGAVGLEAGHVSLAANGDAIGVVVETESLKAMVVKRDLGETNGRVYFRCFAADGTILTEDDVDEVPLIRSASEYRIDWAPDLYGGVFQTRAHFSDDFPVTVAPQVHRLHLLFGGGDTGGELRSFALQAAQQGALTVSPGHPHTTTGNVAVSPPTVGTWPRGLFVSNAEPTINSTARSKWIVDGWRKVTGGDSNELGVDWVEVRSPLTDRTGR